MEQPVSSVRRIPYLKVLVCLLGIICVVALCFPSATRLIFYYRAASMVRAFPSRYPDYSYNQKFYAPDLSRVLAFDTQSDNGVIWDYATQQVIQSVNPGFALDARLAWSPDQRYLLYYRALHSGSSLDLWDLTRQKKVFSVAGNNSSFQSVAWSPDNTRIALLNNNALTLRDAATGRVLLQARPTANGTLSASTVAWSPDSKYLALANHAARNAGPGHYIYQAWVNMLDVSTQRIVGEPLKPITTTDQISDMSLAWSPDGRSLAASLGQQLWLLNPADGSQARRFNTAYTSLNTRLPFAWSPDSTQLAVFGNLADTLTNKELAIWRISDLQKVQVVEQGNLSNAISLYWSPQTQHILLITASGNQETLPLSLW